MGAKNRYRKEQMKEETEEKGEKKTKCFCLVAVTPPFSRKGEKFQMKQVKKIKK